MGRVAALRRQEDESRPIGIAGEIRRPEELEWKDAPASLPPGAKVAVLEGDPSKAGTFVMRFKFPDGYRVLPHTHPKPERVTVLAGALHIGMGATFDASKCQEMRAGTYGTWPAGMKVARTLPGKSMDSP